MPNVLERSHRTYTIVFNTGLPGEWFWFINSHKGFPRVDKLTIREEDVKLGWRESLHTIRQGMGYKLESSEKREGKQWEIERTEFETAIEKGLEMGVGDFDKLIIKIQSHLLLKFYMG